MMLSAMLTVGCATSVEHHDREPQQSDLANDEDNPLAIQGCDGTDCFELGGQIAGGLGDVYDTMQSAGMNWVKHQHKFGTSDAEQLRGVIDEAHQKSMKVLISVTGQERPSSIDFAGVTQFMGDLAALGPDAIEIWNEPNIDREWPQGSISGGAYVEQMLKPAYAAIKAQKPSVLVISGAPAPTGFFGEQGCTEGGCNDDVFVTQMLEAGGASAMDCIGVHHNSGATSPDQTSGHPADAPEDGFHYSWYFVPQLRTYAEAPKANGLPVCLTELGYLSGDDYGGVPSQFSWAKNTSIEEHAAWLGQAVDMLKSGAIPGVHARLAIIFNVNFTGYGEDAQAGYAIVRKDGSCPACEPLAKAVSE
ncbi:MAG: hypothetical protein H6715_02070 [Myxococcales bacterium]|nr:hypothetical protein [Myxococcales bacterium]MCB9707528.1 hypothetical protein [Myxococcales bacterium]